MTNNRLIYYPNNHSPLRCANCASCTKDSHCQLIDKEIRLDGGCEFWQPTDVPLRDRPFYTPPVVRTDAYPKDNLTPIVDEAVTDSVMVSHEWLFSIIRYLGQSNSFEEALEKLDRAFFLLDGKSLISEGFGDRPTYSHVLGVNDVVKETKLPYRPTEDETRKGMGQRPQSKKPKRRNPR